MFSNLTNSLSKILGKMSSKGHLTENNIKDSLQEVKNALLEADVALPVTVQVIEEIKNKAIGESVTPGLTPGQHFIKVVHNALTDIMGKESVPINLACRPPAVILLAGLQGAGKTTSLAKLARQFKIRNKKVLVVSTDVRRPAAIDQLATLAKEIDVDFHPSFLDEDPVEIAKKALELAKRKFYDILMVDTAGRLNIDTVLMDEVKRIHKELDPIETLFVVDAMTGQEAAQVAKEFSEALPLTGVILTKVDGDARGGAALSVRKITGKPIKYIGSGEKVTELQAFHPDRIASSILGMGDVLSIIEQVESSFSEQEKAKLAKKLRSKNFDFNFEDLRDSLEKFKNIGGVGFLLKNLPANPMFGNLNNGLQEKDIDKMIAIINSMTSDERKMVKQICSSRKKRIAKGSGNSVAAVNQLLSRHKEMAKIMKPDGFNRMMRQLGQLSGFFPKGMMK